MNCTCISDLEAKAVAHLNEIKAFKKPVKKVEMGGVGFVVIENSLQTRTMSMMTIELEGQAKYEKRPMYHSYCPFCGVSVEEKA